MPKIFNVGPRPVDPQDDATQFIDAEVAAELVASVGHEMHHQLVQRFIDETNRELQNISENGTLDVAVAETVHKIAGSAAAFGAVPLRNLIASAETALRDGNTAQAETLMGSIYECWAKTKTALESPDLSNERHSHV